MFVDAVTKILTDHVPIEDVACWANERWCAGCTKFDEDGLVVSGESFHIILPGFQRHQAELIAVAMSRGLACR
jgi:hypothetical protein